MSPEERGELDRLRARLWSLEHASRLALDALEENSEAAELLKTALVEGPQCRR